MSTMGLVYNVASSAGSSGGSGEQAMLLRALQDNGRNIMGARACLAAGQPQQQPQQQPAPKNNVSVISLAASEPLEPNCKSSGQALPAYDPSRLKKHGKNGQPPPIAVAKRNARERNRVKQVNNGFATLRQHIPSHVAQGYGDRGKKLSKVETLRMAVEYIRGLQRLLAEADRGLQLEASVGGASSESPAMMPSPTGSLYSSSTHNGSAEVFALDLERQQEVDLMDEEDDVDEDHRQQQQQQQQHNADDEMRVTSSELRDRRPAKRLRDEPRIRAASRLSENQNRERCRRREDNYYKQATFGDEENIEPLANRNNKNGSHSISISSSSSNGNNNHNNHNNHNNNNNNSSNVNNNNVLGSFLPILVQTTTSASNDLSCIKREVQLLDEDESRRSSEDEQQSASEAVILASPSAYAGEIFIENPETGRLVPLKIEEHEAQLVYVSAAEPAYYKAELPDSAAELSWWEQECIVQQMQQQSPAAPAQRPLAHV